MLLGPLPASRRWFCTGSIRLPPKTTSPEADASPRALWQHSRGRGRASQVFVGRVGLSRVHASTGQPAPVCGAPTDRPHQRRRSHSRVGLSPIQQTSYLTTANHPMAFWSTYYEQPLMLNTLASRVTDPLLLEASVDVGVWFPSARD